MRRKWIRGPGYGPIIFAAANAGLSAVAGAQSLVGSSNWSGYYATPTSGTFTDITSTWVIPTVQSSSSGSMSTYSAYWIGFDGVSSGTVEQCGTSADITSNGIASYYAWYEFYPNFEIQIPNSTLAVHAGDTINAEVTYEPGESTTSSFAYYFDIADQTTGKSFTSTQFTSSNDARSSAEWIAEAPTVDVGQGPMQSSIANFGSVTFSNDGAGMNGNSDQALGSLSNSAIEMIQNGAVVTYPSLLNGSGNAFNVNTVLYWNNAGSTGNGVNWDIITNRNWSTGTYETTYIDGSIVLFGDGNNNRYAVTLNTTVSPAFTIFDNNTGAYTVTGSGGIGGTGSLNLEGTNTTTLSTVNTFSGGTFISSGTLIVTANNGLLSGSTVVNNGSLQFTGSDSLGSITGTGTTTVSGTGALTAATFTQAGLVNNGVAKINGAGAVGSITGSGALTIGTGSSNNTLQITAGGIPNSINNTQSSLTVSAGSTLDITNNTMLVHYAGGGSPLAAVDNAVKFGANGTTFGATGANGSITSSLAGVVGGHLYALGYADSTEDANVPAGNVAMVYTLAGDDLLVGTVNFNSFSRLQNNFGQSGKDWSQGDFNHDGSVNFNDFSLLQNNFGQSANVMSPASASTGGTVNSASKISGTVAAAMAVAGLAKTANAGISPAVGPTVTYILSINDNGSGVFQAGHYAVYASVSAGNGGLASYDISLGGTTSITNFSPVAHFDDGTSSSSDAPVGFTLFRTANGVNPATGSQDTVDNGAILVYGMGQSGGSLATHAPSGSTGPDGASTQPVYAALLDLIKGTFSTLPSFTSENTDTGNVFVTNSGFFTEAPTLLFTTIGVPEPATLALLAPAAAGLMMRRRRRQAKA